MKKAALLSMVCALLLSFSFVSADDKAKDEKKVDFKTIKCPVSGQPVKEASSLDFKGGKVYFCCNNCPKAFAEKTKDKANKEGIVLAEKASAQLVSTKQAEQLKCPLTGKAINKDQHETVAGAEVYFCCGNCKGKVAAAKGDEQLALVFSDKAFETGFKVKGAKKAEAKKDKEKSGFKGLKKKRAKID